MGAARHAQRDATGRRTNDHPLLGIGDVVAYLFHTASTNEWRIAADVRMQTRCRQPGGDTNQVLLSNPDFDETLGVACHIRPQAQQVLRVGREHHSLGVTRRDLKQGLAKGEPRLVGCLGMPVVYLCCCRGGHGVSSSVRARAKVSSFTVLLCQT